jgi:hypothetical protein
MKTSRLIQYRELEKFLQAMVRARENIGSFRKSSGYETAEHFFLAAALDSIDIMYCTWTGISLGTSRRAVRRNHREMG